MCRLSLQGHTGGAMELLDFRPVLISWARSQAATLGHKKCFKKGVGALVRQLRHDTMTGATDVFGPAGSRALTLLENNCQMCGKCRGLREPRPSE